MEAPTRSMHRITGRLSQDKGADMTDRERKSMVGAAVLLLGAAAVRFVVATPGPVDPLLGDRPSIADSLLVAGDSALQEKERRSRPFQQGETIDPNVAGDEALDRLPGVGRARALQIVREREENGPFASIDDLARVQGIGPGSVERLRPFLRIDPAVARSSEAAADRGSGSSSGAKAGAGAALGSPGRVNLNRATVEELQAIPGIGPVIARRIVAYRDEHGAFREPRELMEVSGVGEKTFARIAPLVTTGR